MPIQFTRLSSILIATAISGLFTIEVTAQTEPEPEQPIKFESVSTAFEHAYFLHTGNAYDNDSIVGYLNTIFGFNLFPEKQIALDGETVDTLYKDVMQQQVNSGPRLSTRDLVNPYTTSLVETSNNTRIMDNSDRREFNFGL